MIGLIRFLPLDAGLADWGNALAIAGLFTALLWRGDRHHAAASEGRAGLLERQPDGIHRCGDRHGHRQRSMPPHRCLPRFYATHHILVKGAMFLLVGVVAATAAHASARNADAGRCARRRTRRTAAHRRRGRQARRQGAAGRRLGRDRRLRVRRRHDAADAALPAPGDGELRRRSHGGCRAGTALAVGCHGGRVDPGSVGALSGPAARHRVRPRVDPKGLWASLWPVLVGGALAWVLARWGAHLPRIPAGDIAVGIDSGARLAMGAGAALQRTDTVLRQWAVAGVSMLAIAVLFGAALF